MFADCVMDRICCVYSNHCFAFLASTTLTRDRAVAQGNMVGWSATWRWELYLLIFSMFSCFF